MACFLAPLAEAVVISVVKAAAKRSTAKTVRSASDKAALCNTSCASAKENSVAHQFASKLHLLTTMLYAGSFMLAIDHMWNGELVPYFPFFTALKNPEDTKTMLHEIGTVGVSMAALVTIAWAVIVITGIIKDKHFVLSASGSRQCSK